MKQVKASRILYIIIGIYLAGLLYTLAFKEKDVIWDAKLCLKMVDNARQHIPFNYYRHPDPRNLNNDKQEFVAWWSPGQYALPMLIQQAFGVKLSIAIKILIGLCLAMALAGIYKLYRVLISYSFPESEKCEYLTSLALLFTILQPLFCNNVLLYDGGGILLLAYCPWFIYWVLKTARITALNLFLLLNAAFFGFFLKATFSCFFIAALFYLFLAKAGNDGKPMLKRSFKNHARQGLPLVAVFVIYMLILKWAYLSHNRSIADSAMGWRLQPRVLVFPLVAPVFKLLALDNWNTTVYWLAGSPFVIGLYYLLFKNAGLGDQYKRLLGVFLVVVTAFFMMMYAMDTDVSYELRHFSVITLLLIPALLIVTFQQNRGKYFVALCFALCTFNSFQTFRLAPWSSPSAADRTGLLYNYPAGILNKIHDLDSTNGRAIFYFKNTDPLLALQVLHNRVLLEDCFVNFGFDNRPKAGNTLYYGKNWGELFVIYPLDGFKQDSLKFLTRFQKYHQFNTIYHKDGYGIYRANADNR